VDGGRAGGGLLHHLRHEVRLLLLLRLLRLLLRCRLHLLLPGVLLLTPAPPPRSNFTFATVKGSGHMVPQYKPKEAFAMFSAFLAGCPGLRCAGPDYAAHNAKLEALLGEAGKQWRRNKAEL